MKKLLSFLCLFVAGIFVLLWIEKPSDVDPALAAVPAPYPPERLEDSAEAPPRDPSDSPPSDATVAVRGGFEWSKVVTEGPNRGHNRWDIVAQDTLTPGDHVELLGITARVYDENTGDEIVLIKAESGEVTLEGTHQALLEGFQLSDDVVLHGVEVTLLRDAPVVPLTLSTKDLRGELEAGKFSTDGRVEIAGKGLTASGVGFELLTREGVLRFAREGAVDVEVEPGRRAQLTSEGELVISSPAEVPRRIALDANGNASIVLEGREALALDAQHIRIAGRPREGGAEPFGFDRIEAQDDVRLATPTSAFYAQRAEIELLGTTARFRAKLAGEPNGTLAFVPTAGPLTREASAAPGQVTINFRGEGPLEVTRAEGLEFSLPGRGELEWAGARLTAAESITGSFGPGPDEALFVARGDVRIAQGERSVSTEEFQLRRERTAEGVGRWAATAAGPAKLLGRLDAEHTVEFEALERIHVVLDGGVWRVPRAAGVRLVVAGPKGLTARADEVVEFSLEPLGLKATGNVSLEGVQGMLTGDRLVVRGRDNAIVEGTAEEPVHFASDRGEGWARRVELSGELLIAEDVERASLVYEDSVFELTCERLLLSNTSATDASGTLVETHRFTARGAVHGVRSQDGDRREFDCDELEGVHTQHTKDGEFLYSSSLATATGRVTGSYQDGEKSYDVRSDRLQIEYAQRPSQERPSARLLAQGTVSVEYRGDLPLRAEGDELEIDELYRARLSAQGDRRVTVEGYFPKGSHPFAMTCRWIQFSPTFLAIGEPDGEVVWKDAEAPSEEGMHVKIRAQRLEADRERFTLTGDVQIQNTEEGPKSWALNANRASIEGREASNSDPLLGLRAEGNVSFRFGPYLHATGDELSGRVEQRRLRVSGSPARVVHHGYAVESDMIEYDLDVHLLSTGRVKVQPPATDGERR